MYDASGFAYDMPDPKRIEAAFVAVNENNEPIAAVYAERIPQLYFICHPKEKALIKLHVLRLFYDALRGVLKAKGYSSADAFLPPQIEDRFGRFLTKRLGFLANWRSFCIHF